MVWRWRGRSRAEAHNRKGWEAVPEVRTMKDIAKVMGFIIGNPKAFMNVNLWARRQVARGELTRLADSTGTDKAFLRHMYTRIYDDLFTGCGEQIETLLELGLLRTAQQRRMGGGRLATAPSLDMWASYFPKARVYGLDNRDFSDAQGSWEAIISADQSERTELAKVDDFEEAYDVVIDDASHASAHQQISFSYLFRRVSCGGTYIIEDLHYQPERVESATPTVGRTLGYLERLRDEGRWLSPVATPEEKGYIEGHVESVRLFDSFELGIASSDALAVIRKA